MTSPSVNANPEPSKDEGASSPPSGGWFAKLPGLDQSDVAALVGHQRLSQALDLEQKPDNRHLRLSLYFLGGAAALFVPWAALTPLTQVVQASGEVVPEGAVNVVQHLEGGIVSKVDVRDGQEVKEGQVLLELSPKLVGSEYDAAEQKLKNLLLQQKQLQAAIRGDATLSVGDLQGIEQGNKVSAAQQQLLTSRLANRADQLAAARATVQQKQAEVEGLNDQINLQTQQVAMWASLQESGGASRLQLLHTKTQLAEMKGARNEARKALSQAQANLKGVESGLHFENNSQIAELVSEEAVVAENIKKVRNQLERTKVTAPVSGVISDLRYKAPGAVVGPGAVVLQVVPTGSKKLVEVRVPSKDIGFVKVGQRVDVKLQPFDSTIYGSVPGKVLSLAGTTVQDPDTRAYYYLARVELDRQFVDQRRKTFPIQAGMPLVADIQGQRRSVLRYLFQPFTRTMDSALRESR
jgi:HlyD family type I secretion membrane fusion protein